MRRNSSLTQGGDTRTLTGGAAARFLTKRDAVAEYLRNEILSGHLGPGTQVLQEEVAAAVGVSSTPVREAFTVLEAEGFVEHRPHRGVIVSDRSPDEIADLYEVRLTLEVVAARRAAHQINEVTRAKLAIAHADAGRALDRNEIHAFREANHDFHLALVEGSGSRGLADLMNQISSRSRFYVPLDRERMLKAHHEHAEILKAIDAHDSDQASAILLGHMEDNVKQLRSAVASTPSMPLGYDA